ncbi:MAG TPA: sugar phosphate nucleotidyltransferase [Nitrososphaerales archaeon]|nr:sugar phosphate nucleotidyltransferase [Nitrososphaerales archaeon]
MQAAILAGGLGTRLRPLTDLVPKGLIRVNGRPFLELKLEQLKANGIDDVILCVGHLGEMIEEHFGDGSRFGIRIRYSRDGKELLGPVGAVKRAEHLLEGEFFVTYGDNYLRLDYGKMMALLKSSGKLGVLAVYHNRGAYGTSDVEVSEGRVTTFQKNPTRKLEWINFGIYALRKKALDLVAPGSPCDESEFFNLMIGRRELLSYEATERFYEIGNVESLNEFETFMAGRARRPS